MLVAAAIPVEYTLSLDLCVSKTCQIGATSAQVELLVASLNASPPKDSQARLITSTKVGTSTFSPTSCPTTWILPNDQAKLCRRAGSRTTQTIKITKAKTMSWCSNLTDLTIRSSRTSIRDTLRPTKWVIILIMQKSLTRAGSQNCQTTEVYVQATTWE